jgi:hypothetical protein
MTIGQPAAFIGTSSKTDASCFGTSSVTAGTVGAVGTLNYSWKNAEEILK